MTSIAGILRKPEMVSTRGKRCWSRVLTQMEGRILVMSMLSWTPSELASTPDTATYLEGI